MAAEEDTPRSGLPEWAGPTASSAGLPTGLVAALGVVAACLVGLSTYAASTHGFTAVGLSFLAAVALLFATVGLFELGRRLGAG